MARKGLFGLARAASEYVRRRMSRSVQRADEVAERVMTAAEKSSLERRLSKLGLGKWGRRPTPPGSDGIEQRTGAPPVVPPESEGIDWRTGAPPIVHPPQSPSGRGPQAQPPDQPPPHPPRPPVGMPDDDDDGDDIEFSGRDASYSRPDWAAVMDGMRLTPGSSNVYGYYYEFESRTRGILYVTFLGEAGGGKRSGPGHTYAYYDVPGRKYHEFAKRSDASAGGAVWDYLRIRGTVAGHQHNYRLVQSHGDYVPRKATPLGYRTRAVPAMGVGRRSYRRSTLPERLFARPNRGKPDRGTPNRGEPDQ